MAIARQVCQVGFWITAMQAGVALALGIPGEAVMGLVGPEFVGGTGALAFLLIAEVVAATAVVSEAALIYVARIKNLWVSLATISLQAALTVVFMIAIEQNNLPDPYLAARRRDGPDALVGRSLARQGRVALAHPARAGQQLALGAGLGGRTGSRRRLDCDPAARMARTERSACRRSCWSMAGSSGNAASARKIACCSAGMWRQTFPDTGFAGVRGGR